jgi:hypothetical protein
VSEKHEVTGSSPVPGTNEIARRNAVFAAGFVVTPVVKKWGVGIFVGILILFCAANFLECRPLCFSTRVGIRVFRDISSAVSKNGRPHLWCYTGVG